MEKIIVFDAEQAVLGRLATAAAKRALSGQSVAVVNCEKAIVTGTKPAILEAYRKKRARGRGGLKGPYFPRSPAAIVKRTIRGMLPYKKTKGRAALRRVKCYEGVPENYAAAKKIGLKRPIRTEFMSLAQISQLI